MISLIMPVYNTEPYLVQAVDSVTAQTFPEWELILIDDGSTDNAGAMCDAYAAKDHRIRVIHQANAGLSAARNAGLASARGEYLLFVDSDDYLEPDTLQVLMETIQVGDADMVIFDARYEEENRSWHERQTLDPGVYDAIEILKALSKPSIPPYAWNKFCKRRLYAGVLFPAGESWEDVATTFYPVSASKRIAVIDRDLYHYRQRSDAITKKAMRDRSIYKWRFIQYKKRYMFLEDHYPEIAAVAADTTALNGIYYCAYCMNGKPMRSEQKEVRRFLYKGAILEKIADRRIRLLVKGMYYLPAAVLCLIQCRDIVRGHHV